MRQITNHILMVKPTGFNYNAETAANNHFQHSNLNFSNKEITENAIREFDKMVELLDIKERSKGQILIKYKVMIEIKNEAKPALIANWLIIQLYG